MTGRPYAHLNGRVAVVTGASRGIGRATAVELSRAGSHVFAAARSAEPLEDLERAMSAEGRQLTAVRCDVAVQEDVDRLFAAADGIGGLDILVCAAGVLRKLPFEQIELSEWQTVLGVNLTGTFLCCQRAFASMKHSGGGSIVTIASLSGVYGVEKFPGLVAYNVSKFGVVGLTEGLAVEGRAHGIAAVCLSPGAVDTQMLREANPDLRAGLQAEDVAELIAGLLDGDLSRMSGANIPLFSNLPSPD